MGTESSDEYPEVDPEKWYCAYVEEYFDFDPEHEGCEMACWGGRHMCVLGQALLDFFAMGGNCVGIVFGVAFPGTVHRLIKFVGPYDTFDICHPTCV